MAVSLSAWKGLVMPFYPKNAKYQPEYEAPAPWVSSGVKLFPDTAFPAPAGRLPLFVPGRLVWDGSAGMAAPCQNSPKEGN